MFHTYDFLEDEQQSSILGSLFNQPGLRRFPCFEVPLNVQILHVDFDFNRGESRWQRYVFYNLDHMLAFVEHEEPKRMRVSVQTRRQDGAEYRLKMVKKILEGRAVDGRLVSIFLCMDGSILVEPYYDIAPDDLADQMCVWDVDDFER